MALFPRIQSPCPYRDNLSAIMDGDFCRMCQRQVHDISAMSDDERVALIAGCKEEICVSYRVSAKTALAAAAMSAALGMPMAAAAQDAGVQGFSDEGDYSQAIIVGGLKKPKQAKWVDTKKPAGMAELPVVYETEPTKPAPAKAVQPPAKPVNPAS